MSEFDENVHEYRRTKQDIIKTVKTEAADKINAGVLSNASAVKERKLEGSANAYMKILAADFDTADWISREAPLRKHRKNINENYKSLTGRKSGLSGKEKLRRKKEFEARRDLSLKASMALEAFIGRASEMDPDPSDEGLLRTIEETDLSGFAYGSGGKTKQDVECDAEFITGFAEHMAVLHRSSLLYNRLLQGNSDPVSPELLNKLSVMNDMRQAYEDRIRIISSPYYVSLREVDFDESTKEKLRTGEDDEKRGETLNDYARSVLRWQESGRRLLFADRVSAQAPLEEKAVPQENVLLPDREYESDRAADQVIEKIDSRSKDLFKKMVNGYRDQPMIYTREWVYKDLKDKPDAKKMLHEVDRMKDRLRRDLKDETLEENARKSMEKVLRHLDRVSDAFAAKKISPEAMRIWLDRCLQHKLNYSGELYLNLVHQGKTEEDEEDYFGEAEKVIDPYVKQMSGVIFAQSSISSYGVYQRKADTGDTEDPAIRHARRGCSKKMVHAFSGMGDMSIKSRGSDFIHISGKNVDYNNITARAYISAKPRYKSLVLRLFTETIEEFEHKNMREEIYFKISTEKNRDKGYAADDLTVYLGANVSVEERKQLLDSFYEKCSKMSAEKGESILDGENMIIAGSRYRDGIALAGEPDIATLLNTNFSNADKKFRSAFSKRKRMEKLQNMTSGGIKAQFSFNTFVVAMLVQSTFVAGYRLGTELKDDIDTNDPGVREEIRKVFRELCFLNGINPENMADIDNKSALG